MAGNIILTIDLILGFMCIMIVVMVFILLLKKLINKK